jgi:phytoene synthase
MQAYCLDIIKKHDPDRFLLSLFVPYEHRPALWALFVFNYEIAKTREVVSETQIGLIRLQWWREAIAEIYDGKTPREHQVVEALAEIIKTYDLPREEFDNLIYAREFDLEGVAPANMEGFINYCDFTNTPLNRLVLRIIGESEDESILKAVSVHYAAIGLVRAVSYMRMQGRVMLPADILAQNNLSEKKMLDFREEEKISQVVKEVLSGINQFRYGQNMPKTRFLKAMRKMAALYANQIESVQGNVYDSRLGIAPRFMALRLWGASHF